MAHLHARYLVSKFEKYFCSRLILDAGCGKGALEPIIKTIPDKNFRAEFVGIDVSLHLLSTAKSLMTNVVRAVAGQLPSRNKAFNAAFSVEVLEDLPKEQTYNQIKGMGRISKNFVVPTTPSHFFAHDACEIPQVRCPMMDRSLWSANEFGRLG